jgi:hypothetical protein
MEFELYFSDTPAPKHIESEQLERMMPARFSTEDDAVYGAALVIRGGQYPWRIEGPGVSLDAMEIGRRCEPILQVLRR